MLDNDEEAGPAAQSQNFLNSSKKFNKLALPIPSVTPLSDEQVKKAALNLVNANDSNK